MGEAAAAAVSPGGCRREAKRDADRSGQGGRRLGTRTGLQMIIEYEGERYEFDFDDITVKQAMKIEKHTGVKLTDWGDRLEAGGDMLSLQALGWLVLFGGAGAVDDADFKLVKLGNAFAAAITAQAAAEKAAAGPVPTVAVPASNDQTPEPAVPAPSAPFSVPASP